MGDYKRTKVLSIRMAPELLRAVRDRAAADGRSISGEIVSLVAAQMELFTQASAPPRPLTGWLQHLEVLDSHEEFHSARAELGRSLLRSAQTKARDE